MKLRWTERQRWWLLAAGWLVLIVFGIGGFHQQSRDLGLDNDLLDHVYFTLQLAALDFEGASSAINWRLQVARFAAPLMATTTLAQGASVVFRDQLMRWRAGRARGHTVVCGLASVGTRLAEALVADGRTVVAIAEQGGLPGAAALERAGVPVVVGDPTETEVLDVVGAHRAARVVAATDSDAVNVAIAGAVGQLRRPSASLPVRVAVRLDDGELAHLLRATELAGEGAVRLEFFNVHERAAQVLVAAHPLQPAADPGGNGHLVVMGVGQFGGLLVVAAAQRWAERDAGPLRVTLIDRHAENRLYALTMRHPALQATVVAEAIDLDFAAPSPAAVARFEARLGEHAPSLVVAAFDDDALAWTSALFIRQRLTEPVDIVVRTDSDGGLGAHLHEAVGERAAGGRVAGRVIAFPIHARACTTDLIEGGVREQLARALHDDHLARVGTGTGLRAQWSELSDDQRESSREAADAIVARLAAIGARLVPLAHWHGVADVFTVAELDSLAAAEHARWKGAREAAGWTWGAVRDDAAQHNPLLVDWQALPATARADNVAAARNLPGLLARAGFEITR